MLNMLTVAQNWYKNGTTPIPCLPQSKIPTVKWSRWMCERPPRGLIQHWFSKDHNQNIALITGGAGALVVLDFDDLDRYRDWIRDTQVDTYTVSTPRPGMHVYLRTKPTSSMHLNGVEVKGTRSCVMSPPSIHPSGHPYEVASNANIAWVDSLSDVGLEETVVYCSVKEMGHTSTLIGSIRHETPLLLLLSTLTNPIPSTADGRWFVMRCPHPQHTDRNPSFWCDAYRGICGCFAHFCRDTHPNRKPMDVINLYAWIHGITNQEAIQELS